MILNRHIAFFFALLSYSLLGQAKVKNQAEVYLTQNQKETNPEKKIGLNIKLAEIYLTENQFEEALKTLKQNITLGKEKNKIKLADTYTIMARAYIALAEIDSAYLFINKALPLLKNQNNPKAVAKCYFYLSQVYQYKADFIKQADYSFKSIAIAEKVKDTSLLEYNYRNLAMLYLDQHNYPEALKKSFLSVKYAKQINTPKRIGIALGSVAETYSMMHDSVKAEKYFKAALDESRKAKHLIGIAWNLTNWANLKTNDDEEIKMRTEAQEIWDEISPENIMSANNQGNLGNTYYEMALKLRPGDLKRTQILDKAETYLKKSIAISLKSENLTNYLEFLKTLSKVYGLKGDYKKAFESQEVYQQKNDSLFSQENKNAIAKLESEKEIAIKNKEIQLNKLQLESKERQKWFYLLGIVSLAAVGGLLLYQNTIRKKVNVKLQALNSELNLANKTKTRLFSILNHDLRSPVSSLIHFLHLQKESPELLDEASKTRLQDKTILGAENLLNSMEDILQWSKSQMENFKPNPKTIAIAELFEEISNHFSSEEEIQIFFKNPEKVILKTDKDYLKTIMRNLTGNAVKVLKGTDKPLIIWEASKKEGVVYLKIQDNGPGAKKEQFRALYDEKEVAGIKSGLGMHLIRDLAKAIHCEIEVDSKIDFGTTILIKLKSEPNNF